MNQDYRTLQAFFHDHIEHTGRWLNWPEREVLNRYFLLAGKKRSHVPQSTQVILEDVASLLFDRGGSKHFPTKDHAYRAAERGLSEGKAKLVKRRELLEADRGIGLQAPNSLALADIDLHLIEALRPVFRTVNGVAEATDEAILALPNIDRKKLGQIRAKIKHRSPIVRRKQEAALVGQLSLF